MTEMTAAAIRNPCSHSTGADFVRISGHYGVPLPQSRYADLASKVEVWELIQGCVEMVNAELAGETGLADSQIRRFLILHKELDPDDDELTRTRKVRRGFIAEKYKSLVDALYEGRSVQHIETLVRFEDGRTGTVSADLAIHDVGERRAHATS